MFYHFLNVFFKYVDVPLFDFTTRLYNCDVGETAKKNKWIETWIQIVAHITNTLIHWLRIVFLILSTFRVIQMCISASFWKLMVWGIVCAVVVKISSGWVELNHYDQIGCDRIDKLKKRLRIDKLIWHNEMQKFNLKYKKASLKCLKVVLLLWTPKYL